MARLPSKKAIHTYSTANITCNSPSWHIVNKNIFLIYLIWFLPSISKRELGNDKCSIFAFQLFCYSWGWTFEHIWLSLFLLPIFLVKYSYFIEVCKYFINVLLLLYLLHINYSLFVLQFYLWRFCHMKLKHCNVINLLLFSHLGGIWNLKYVEIQILFHISIMVPNIFI